METGDYTRTYPQLGWTIKGWSTDEDISIIIDQNPDGEIPLAPATFFMKLKAWWTHMPQRPKNHGAKNGRRTYSAAKPFPLGK